MTEALIRFAVSAAVIVVAGIFLTRSGDAIAERTGLGRLLIGGILVAAATSLPELAVDISAVRQGTPDIALGDLMGSSLFNLLILAIADLLHRAPGSAFSRTGREHSLSASLSILLTALAGMAILAGKAELGVAGIGVGPPLIAAGYLFGMRMVYRDQRRAADERAPGQEDDDANKDDDAEGGSGRSLGRPVLGFIACAAVIVVAAPHLARSAGTIAEETGLGGTFVGTAMVALSTALPELVTTLSAVRIGAFDMAVGNMLGSNAFNMVLLLPIDLAHDGLLLSDVSTVHAFTALAVIMVTSVVVMGQLYRVESRKAFIEPDALLVITLVLGTLAAVYALGGASSAE